MKLTEKRVEQKVLPRGLIIEDDRIIAELYTVIFQNVEIPVDLCNTYTEAIELLKKNCYTFVVTDCVFPFEPRTEASLNGDKILSYIHQHMRGKNRRPYVVVASASIRDIDLDYYKTKKAFDLVYEKPMINFPALKRNVIKHRYGIHYGRRRSDHISSQVHCQGD